DVRHRFRRHVQARLGVGRLNGAKAVVLKQVARQFEVLLVVLDDEHEPVVTDGSSHEPDAAMGSGVSAVAAFLAPSATTPSRTHTTTSSPAARALTSTCPPRSVNFTALVSRLKSTCLSLRSSASMTPMPGSTSRRSAMP